MENKFLEESYEVTVFESLIRQDVENGTFHAQNIFNPEYLKPLSYKYVKGLEKENAELKAQIPQWHDLRKNPNDLPKETGEYFTNIGLLYYDKLCDRYFWHTISCEACDYSDEVEENEVIAWCEIPKLKG